MIVNEVVGVDEARINEPVVCLDCLIVVIASRGSAREAIRELGRGGKVKFILY